MPQLAAIDVLVVEDHAASLKMMCQVLKALGVGSVRGVSSGSQALHQMAIRCPDILLADWEMPGISGLDLVEFVRTSPDSPDPAMPIIMVSAHSTRERVLRARAIGVNEFLVKPFDAATLAYRLWACIDLHHGIPRPPALRGQTAPKPNSADHISY
jgi:CheY-like chemotaxis protein